MKELIMIIVSSLLGILVNIIRGYLEAKGGSALLKTVEIIVKNSVTAVEQITADKDIKGKMKFDMAMDKVVDALTQRNITVSKSELETLVEAAVFEMNRQWQGESKEGEYHGRA